MTGGPQTGRLALTALLTVVALTVAGCTLGPSRRPELAVYGGTAPATATPTPGADRPLGPGGPGRTAEHAQWRRCPGGFPGAAGEFTIDCTSVHVPTSYDGADAPELDLAVGRARGPGVAADAPPLVVVFGGPGAAGRDEVAKVAAELPVPVRDHFAIITLDLRGTGASSPVDCMSAAEQQAITTLGADPTSPDTAARLESLARAITFDCTGGPDGESLTDFNSTTAADDLDTLRAALGVDKVAFLGRGFGATLGAVYADRYPGRIAAMVLDSPDDPHADPAAVATARAIALEHSLAAFAAACASFTGGCPLGPDPRAAVADLVKTLRPAGIPSRTMPRVNDGSVLRLLAEHLGSPADWPDLAAALAALRSGDPAPAAGLLVRGTQDNIADRLLYACNDHALRLGPAQLADKVSESRRSAPLFGPYLLGQVALCADWPAPQNPLGAVKAAGAPPILVVGAVDDPVSPYPMVQSVATQLESATLISWQSGAHGGYPASPCVAQAVNSYLLTGSVPGIGRLCPP